MRKTQKTCKANAKIVDAGFKVARFLIDPGNDKNMDILIEGGAKKIVSARGDSYCYAYESEGVIFSFYPAGEFVGDQDVIITMLTLKDAMAGILRKHGLDFDVDEINVDEITMRPLVAGRSHLDEKCNRREIL